MENISECIIDDQGIFKYIQILVQDIKDETKKKVIIRGNIDCNYHKNIFDNFIRNYSQEHPKEYEQLKFTCVGGGRIERTCNHIKAYGYSYGYGQADHAVTCEILKNNLPKFYEIEYSNEGY